jgi:F-type H+-transporting ATPase subunit b
VAAQSEAGVILISTAYAQTETPEPHGEPAAELHTGTEAAAGEHGGEHSTFPPFDPATFASQLVWLAISFGLLLFLMSRVAIPRIDRILTDRANRIAGDLAEAARLKAASDAAIAAHEQALTEARQNAHSIGQKARDVAKAEIAADRGRIEAELNGRLSAAESEIAGVKTRALAEVDAIARDAVEAMVEALVGTKAGKSEIARAVEAAMAERA